MCLIIKTLFLLFSKIYFVEIINLFIRCIDDILNLKDKEQWKDPEFGPTNADPNGSNSLFKNLHTKPESTISFNHFQ